MELKEQVLSRLLTADGGFVSGGALSQELGVSRNAVWKAIARLREMEIEGIFAAHHYHPLGRIYRGRDEICAALDACLAPLDRMEALIAAHPDMTDEEICALYNDAPMTPTLGAHVIKAVRRAMSEKND